MKRIKMVEEIMMDFARLTGLEPQNDHPKRYLWTDAFAVCNYIELSKHEKNQKYLNLAIELVNQVHHILGKHRGDDSRSGWISGLEGEEAEMHPTVGGLRIGKKLNERKPNEPADQRLEWDQDGQYYHYLTKWMHALNKISEATGDKIYLKWALELVKAAHKGFTYLPANRERKIMYWKMSIDLTYPLVFSMGQHDPLDGFITYKELQISAKEELNAPKLDNEIREIADICRGMNLATSDPLGIGGLLFDATRVAQFIAKEDMNYNELLELILTSALIGLSSFENSNPLRSPPKYRLAFRELGLSIGFNGIMSITNWLNEDKISHNSIQRIISSILSYLPLKDLIENFWMQRENRQYESWIEHEEINMVMLATSLAPDEFITI